jgi:hypothetical protein
MYQLNIKDFKIKNEFEIINDKGVFRFVNHAEKLLTTGFSSTESKLIEYKDAIRFDNTTLKIMSDRYKATFINSIQ